MSKSVMGTLAWGRQTKGALSSFERLKVVKNIAFLRTRELFDKIRSQTGLLKPAPTDIEEFKIPDSCMVRDALEIAEEGQSQALYFHCWRSYYFAAMIAKHDELQFDPEILITSALLHDMALTENPDIPPIDTCCFAVSGGLYAQESLTQKGHEREKVDQVAEAISLHLNLNVPRKKFGNNSFLLARGACCDVFGAGIHRLHASSLKDLLDRYPRDDIEQALGFGIFQHMPGSRPDFMGKLFGNKAPPTPF